MHLRQGRLDEPAIVDLVERLQGWYTDLYGAPDRDPLHADDYAPPRGRFLIAEDGDEPVAIGGYSLTTHDARPAAKLRRMYVVPEHQRRGLATRVLDALEAAAAADGADAVVLETGAPQRAAVAFYRARGYTDVPAFGFYADSPDSVHLAKRVG